MEKIKSKNSESVPAQVPAQVTPQVDVSNMETLPFDMSPVAKNLEKEESPPPTFSSRPPKTFKEIAEEFQRNLLPKTMELPGSSIPKEEIPNVQEVEGQEVPDIPNSGPQHGDVSPKKVPESPVEEIPATQPSPPDLFHADTEVRRKEQMQERDRMKPPKTPRRKRGPQKKPSAKKVTPKKKATPKPKAKSKASAKAKAKSKKAKVTEGQDGMAETGEGDGEKGGDDKNGEKPEGKPKEPRAKKAKVTPSTDVSAEPAEPSGKKTFARRARPLHGPGMIRWDAIKRVFIAHVANHFERPSPMEDWVEQGWP